MKTGAGGAAGSRARASQHAHDFPARVRDRAAPRKSGAAPRGPRRSSGARGPRASAHRSDSEQGTGARSGGPHRSDAEGERLQKVLSRAGLASRREVEDWIRAGRITVNGQPAVLGVRVSSSDQLRLDGRLIRQRESNSGPTVFVVHRSPGESLTQPNAGTADESSEAPVTTTMIDRLPNRAGRRFITISPMPRVDGGLELVTSDGELGVMLQRSVHKLVSQFSVRILGELSEQQLEGILGGMLDSGEQLEVQTCEPSGGEGANRWYTFVARGASGKEVRQLFERQGAVVSRVQRTHLGPITMERTLGRGHFRELTTEELSALTASPDE
ncbi:MAG TPA: S4 domain-containing protein [Steroidobacteraceae bacterium]